MKLHSKVTLSEDIIIQGYKTLEKGTKLEVVQYNKRYIYAIEPFYERNIIQLTYKNIGKKSPIKRRKPSLLDPLYGKEFADKVRASTTDIERFIDGEFIDFTAQN